MTYETVYTRVCVMEARVNADISGTVCEDDFISHL